MAQIDESAPEGYEKIAMGRIIEFVNKIQKRHKWSLRQQLIAVAVYDCEYCYALTWKGQETVLPVGESFAYANSNCDRKKVMDK